MIHKKSRDEIKRMCHAGHIVALVHQIIKENRAIPTFLGYHGFPGCICTSINEQVVHGIPSEKVILKEGDIIAIDVGATYGGMVGDSAWSYGVGKIASDVEKLLKVTEESLYAGIDKMCPGNVLDDISKAIESVANREGYGIVRQYGGHGVGHEMHEDPFLFNYSVGDNTLIRPNIAIAIEPMLNLGCDDVIVEEDDWTVSTKDGKPSAHFEHTVIATDDGPLITTKLMK